MHQDVCARLSLCVCVCVCVCVCLCFDDVGIVVGGVRSVSDSTDGRGSTHGAEGAGEVSTETNMATCTHDTQRKVFLALPIGLGQGVVNQERRASQSTEICEFMCGVPSHMTICDVTCHVTLPGTLRK